MKHFLTLLLAFTGCGFALLVAFNFQQDPYGIYRPKPIFPRTAYAVDLFYYLRLTKAWQIPKLAPQALYMGSSRAALMRPPGVNDGSVFNAALPGVTPKELRDYTEHALLTSPVKRITLGLDYTVFCTPDSRPVRKQDVQRLLTHDSSKSRLAALWRDFPDYLDTLISSDATLKSLQAMRQQRDSGLMYYSDGTWAVEKSAGQRFPGVTNYKIILKQYRKKLRAAKSSCDFQQLKEIIVLTQRHKVALQLYFSPVHALVLSMFQREDHYAARQRWQADVVALVETLQPADKRSVPAVYGFELDAAALTAKVEERRWFQDGLHVGEDFAHQISLALDTDLDRGSVVRLYANNIDDYLRQCQRLIQRFQQTKPEMMRLLQEI